MSHAALRFVGLLAGTFAFLATAWAQSEDPALSCPSAEPLQDKYQYARSLSLALRGTVPTIDEYESLHELEDVPEAWIDAWLSSSEFSAHVSRYHRRLLWNRVENRNPYRAFGLGGGGPGQAPASDYHQSVVYRGDHVGCLDEPVELDANGYIIAKWSEELEAYQEGYVWVAPYWALDTELKVCAYNAQTTFISPTGTECGTVEALADPYCGCGPNLQWCSPASVDLTIRQSMGIAVEKTIELLIQEGRPYTDLFLDNMTLVNGPLVHMWRYFAHRAAYLDRTETMLPLALDPDTLPDIPYSEVDTWVPVELPPFHAGVFTSPAYLLRFTTNRRRARQFYESFLCKPFLPPKGGLVIDEESAKEPDLQERTGCNYCHKTLKPASSHWGRWGERGAGYLDPAGFPAFREECEFCALYGSCPFDCKRYYVTGGYTSKETDTIGWLHSYQFLKDKDEPKVEYGPELLFELSVVDGTIARCTTRNVVDWLTRRPVPSYETEWVEGLASAFAASGYDFKSLVKAILTDPRFRRSL